MDQALEKWIELDEIFLSDVPPIVVGRGKNKQTIPNPDIEPTAYYLFTNECTRLARSIRRKRRVVTLTGKGYDDLDSQLTAFVERPNVVYQEKP